MGEAAGEYDNGRQRTSSSVQPSAAWALEKLSGLVFKNILPNFRVPQCIYKVVDKHYKFILMPAIHFDSLSVPRKRPWQKSER